MGFKEGPQETSFFTVLFHSSCFEGILHTLLPSPEATSPHTYTFIHKHMHIEHTHTHTLRQAGTHTIARTCTWVSLAAQMVKNLPAPQETWVGQIPWRRAWQPTPVFLPGESPRTEEPDRLTVHGVAKNQT